MVAIFPFKASSNPSPEKAVGELKEGETWFVPAAYIHRMQQPIN
jgi:hypothetical protein